MKLLEVLEKKLTVAQKFEQEYLSDVDKGLKAKIHFLEGLGQLDQLKVPFIVVLAKDPDEAKVKKAPDFKSHFLFSLHSEPELLDHAGKVDDIPKDIHHFNDPDEKFFLRLSSFMKKHFNKSDLAVSVQSIRNVGRWRPAFRKGGNELLNKFLKQMDPKSNQFLLGHDVSGMRYIDYKYRDQLHGEYTSLDVLSQCPDVYLLKLSRQEAASLRMRSIAHAGEVGFAEVIKQVKETKEFKAVEHRVHSKSGYYLRYVSSPLQEKNGTLDLEVFRGSNPLGFRYQIFSDGKLKIIQGDHRMWRGRKGMWSGNVVERYGKKVDPNEMGEMYKDLLVKLKERFDKALMHKHPF